MALTAAIAATTEAVIRLLRSSYDPARFGSTALDFQVYVSSDFSNPMDEGVSIFLYRIYCNGVQRTPPGRTLNGKRQKTKLPLDLHFLLTIWARKASMQHEIAGWAMRVLEDNATLHADLLNAYRHDVFGPEEGVDLMLADLSVEEMFRIWEVMIPNGYQLSVPYMARVVQIESLVEESAAARVQDREQDVTSL